MDCDVWPGMVWRPTDDGFYEVNGLGEIRRAKPGISTFVGRPVRPTKGSTGYAQVQLRKHRRYVHHVVAEAFIGPRPDGYVINHINGNRLDNRAENLEYVTPQENAMHALEKLPRTPRGPRMPKRPPKGKQVGDRHWTRRTPDRIARGERMAHSITETEVRQIRAIRALGMGMQRLADVFGISIAQVSRIVRGTRWSHVT